MKVNCKACKAEDNPMNKSESNINQNILYNTLNPMFRTVSPRYDNQPIKFLEKLKHTQLLTEAVLPL